MDTEKCTAFLKTLELGTMSAAAKELGYTVSGISRLIVSMEEETGFSLLHRDRHGVSLTKEGEIMLPHIRELAHYGNLYHQTADNILGLEQGHVTIGTAYLTYYPWISEVIAAFTSAHPDIVVEVIEARSSALAKALHEHTIDACFISERPGDHDFHVLLQDPVVAMLPKDHPLANRKSFPAKAFEKEPFIAILPDEETDNAMYMAENDIHPNIRFTTGNENLSIPAMVRAGLGITSGNQLILKGLADDLVLLPVSPKKVINIGLAHLPLSQATPAARALLEYALPKLSTIMNFS